MTKISKVYTRTGDKGTTGLIGGTRVKKYDVRLEAYGTVDELNSWIGLLHSQNIDKKQKEILVGIQQILFVIGSQLATDRSKIDISNRAACKAEDIALLEKEMDQMSEELPELKNFILPGGSQTVSFCHIARTVCRRAERRAYELAEKEEVHPNLLKYLNRLSDFLFVLARKIGKDSKMKEIIWE